MLVRTAPDVPTRLDRLGAGSRFEACGEVYRGGPEVIQQGPVYVATAGSGRKVPLLKILLTDRCVGGCRYCAFRAARDVRRTTLTPDELARSFVAMHAAGRVEGLFLSSGIDPDPVTAMTRQLEAAELLRARHRFRGYLHLKILPGIEQAQLEAAVRLASRVSVNLEAPSRDRLRALAPGKSRPRLLRTQLDQLRALTARGVTARSGWTTQYVVGPAGENDGELLRTSDRLYRRYGLTRAYYSRFEPVPGTPLDDRPPTDGLRQHRLYQADTLLRQYGFAAGELALDRAGNLPATLDPKQAWARAHPERFPLEVNRADPAELIRVPGLGPVAVRRIVAARRVAPLRDADALRALGVSTARCAGLLTAGGRLVGGQQLSLFAA